MTLSKPTSRVPTPLTRILWVFVVGSVLTLLPAQLSRAAESDLGGMVSIPFKNDGLPASDLSFRNSAGERVLTPAEAWDLKTRSNVDLSALDPETGSDVWPGRSTAEDSAQDQALPIEAGQTVQFQGTIQASIGRIRFNVLLSGQDGVARTFNLIASKTAHTLLLRKELLRILGYRVPAMKHLASVRIRFKDAATRDFFLDAEIPNATNGGASRWIVGARSSESLEVVFQDVIAMEPSPLFYNLALGAPLETIGDTDEFRPAGPRTLRALALIYGWADLAESVNQFDSVFGRIEGESFSFRIGDAGNFACTLDDALWIARRIRAFSRADLAAVVERARFPGPVARVLLEKLAARRNSLMSALAPSLGAVAPLAVDPRPTQLPELQDGKLLVIEWPGYASHFSYGEQQSPLQGLRYYFLSQAESNVLSNLMSWANRQLPGLTLEGQGQAHQEKILQGAISRFLKNGEVSKLGFGAWVAPLAGGGVNISRQVVIGNYLGTNNLIQLADTFSLSMSAGLMIGFDNPSTFTRFSGLVQGAASVQLTHLKPMTALKQAVTEPLRQTLVPLIFRNAADVMRKVAAARTVDGKISEQARLAISADLERLREYIGVGESLIFTESLSGVQSLAAGFRAPVPGSPTAQIQGGFNELILSRLHFQRKDADTMVVYKDNGELVGANIGIVMTVGAQAAFPVLSITAKGVTGTAKSRVYSLNISPNLRDNPKLFAHAAALGVALRTGSVEAMDDVQKPTRVTVGFRDLSTSFRFLHYVRRTLRTNGKVKVVLPDGTSGDFISLSDGKQSGSNYQSLATQVGTYLAQRLSGNGNVQIDTQVAPIPGQSFLGRSLTRQAEFQGRVENGLADPFVRIQYRWQGWDMPAAEVVKTVEELNRRYGFEAYPKGFLTDTRKIQLYTIALSFNLYESALRKLGAITPAEEKAIAKSYGRRNRCELYLSSIGQMTGEEISACAGLEKFGDALRDFRKAGRDAAKQSETLLRLAANLERFADFKEIVRLAGGAQNVFVRSVISGFRIGSETLQEPVRSNTYGRADEQYPDGVLDFVQKQVGIGDGEFDMQWIREFL